MKRFSLKLAALLALCALPLALRPAAAQSLSPIETSSAGWYGSVSSGATFGYSIEADGETANTTDNSSSNARIAPPSNNNSSTSTTQTPLDFEIDTVTVSGLYQQF